METVFIQRLATGSPKNRAYGAIIGFCISSGGVFGMLALVAAHTLYRMTGPLGLAFAFVIGCVTGLACSIPAMPLLVRRNLNVAKPIIAWGTSLVILIFFAASQGSTAAFVSAPFVFLFSALAAWRVLPRINLNPGHCARCNYDLRGSFQFGRCPECGEPIDEGATAPKSCANLPTRDRPGFVRRIQQFALRHPLVVILILISAWLGRLHALDLRRAYRTDALAAAMKKATINGLIDIDQLTNFAWDRAFVYGPYANPSVPTGVDASSWKSMMQDVSLPLLNDSQMLVVFVENTRVAECLFLPRYVDFSTTVINIPIERKKARFRIVQETLSAPYRMVLEP